MTAKTHMIPQVETGESDPPVMRYYYKYPHYCLLSCIPLMKDNGFDILDIVYKDPYNDAQDYLFFG